MKTELLIIIVFLFFLGCRRKQHPSESLPEHGLLWKITGNGLQSPSYLFGTYHFPGGMSVLDSIPSFDSIFTSTNQLICEMDFRNAINLLQGKKDTSNSFLKPWPVEDSTYVNLLTDEQNRILDSVFNSDEALRIIRDWNLRPIQTMSYFKYRQQKNAKDNTFQNNDYSFKTIRTIILDGHLQQQADKYNMTILELDSAEELQRLNDSFSSHLPQASYKSEAELLLYYIQNYREIDSLQNESLNEVLSAYLKQDLSLLGYQQKEINRHGNMILSFFGNDAIAELYIKLMIDERNAIWMNKIPGMIKDNPSFIAVGAGHLGGTMGLINRLRELNYTVVSVVQTDNAIVP